MKKYGGQVGEIAGEIITSGLSEGKRAQ